MNRDDIIYVLEILEDAVSSQDWEPINEAQQFLKDCLVVSNKSSDEE